MKTSKRNSTKEWTRGNFLKAGCLAAAAMGLSGRAESAELTSGEKANLDLVNEFCASWATRDLTKIMPFFADNCVYRITETRPPLNGREAILQTAKTFVEANRVEFKVLDSFAKGPVVVNERIDTFVLPQRTNTYHVAGMFFVQSGKIAEWTDYVIRP